MTSNSHLIASASRMGELHQACAFLDAAGVIAARDLQLYLFDDVDFDWSTASQDERRAQDSHVARDLGLVETFSVVASMRNC